MAAQLAKTRNEGQYRAVLELRRSNAATPIPSGTRYRRRPKHRDSHLCGES